MNETKGYVATALIITCPTIVKHFVAAGYNIMAVLYLEDFVDDEGKRPFGGVMALEGGHPLYPDGKPAIWAVMHDFRGKP